MLDGLLNKFRVGGFYTTLPYNFFNYSTQQKFEYIKLVSDMWVHPYSNLKTDSWSAYYRVASDLNFNSHKTVNHFVEFIAPGGTNTQ